MEIVGIRLLEKLKRKNVGNQSLINSIDRFVEELKIANWSDSLPLLKVRPDADLAHHSGFYFFNLQQHRTLVLIEFEVDGGITIVWCGSHDDYELNFKNNKSTIRRWLKTRGWI